MKNVLGIIMAFDKCDEMSHLTEHRTLAATPFGGRYRVVDFMLSSMVNSGITNVGVVMRDKYQSLIDHLGTGKFWDLSRKVGGIRLLPPYSYAQQSHHFDIPERRGKIEGLIGVYDFIKKSPCEYVVISDANIVTNIDLKKVIKAHKESEADVTCVAIPKKCEHTQHTYFTLDSDNNITDVNVSLDISGKSKHTALGIYVMKKDTLENLVAIWATHNMRSFELEGLSYVLKNMKMKAYIHETFAAKITSVKCYYNASMALLSKDVRDELFIRKRPIFTKVYDEQPTYYGDKCESGESLIADGCTIEGIVENSILFRDVTVAKGAVVKNSIVLPHCVISENAVLSHVIPDGNVNIGKGKTIMGHENYPIVISKYTTI